MVEEVELIVKSKIKAAVPELSVASDVPEALNKKVLDLLTTSVIQ